MMKKVFALMLALALCLSLGACAAKAEKVEKTDSGNDVKTEQKAEQKTEQKVTESAVAEQPKSYEDMSLEEKLEYKAAEPLVSAESFDNGLIAPAKDAESGLWGYIDSMGNWVIQPEYYYAGAFSGNFAPVLDEYSEYKFIKRDGSTFVSSIFKKSITGVTHVSDGYMAVSADVSYEASKVYMSIDGISIIYGSKLPVTNGVQYDHKDYFMIAGPFQSGHAVTMRKTNASLLEDMNNNRANIAVKGYYQSACIINYQGDVIATLPAGYDVTDFALDENDLIIVRDMTTENCFYGICDIEGNVVVECKYQRIEHCEGDQYLVCDSNGFWGYISGSGNTIVEAKYEDAYPFSDGLAAVCENGLWGVIDVYGNTVIEPVWDEFAPLDFASLDSNAGSAAFSFGVAAARKGVYWAIINKNNDILLAVKSYECPFGNLSGYLMSYCQSDLWGCINSQGCICIEPQFAEIGVFN